jgi:hypothetical protein
LFGWVWYFLLVWIFLLMSLNVVSLFQCSAWRAQFFFWTGLIVTEKDATSSEKPFWVLSGWSCVDCGCACVFQDSKTCFL